MNTTVISLICTLVALAGCSSQTSLTIKTQPEGGYITVIGGARALGIAPAVSYYDSDKLRTFKSPNGCYRVQGVEARWVSGATAKSDDLIQLCGPLDSAFTIVLSRNPADPDFEKDLQFSLQLQSTRAQQLQASAAQDAANAAALGVLAPKANNNVSCTTRTVGATVKTDCNSR